MTVRTSYCLLIAALATSSAYAQPKGFNYDESKVPDFTLPDPLTLENGDPVADADTWKNTVDLSGVTLTTEYYVIDGSGANYVIFDAGDAFGIKPVTGATADADATAELFGYLF